MPSTEAKWPRATLYLFAALTGAALLALGLTLSRAEDDACMAALGDLIDDQAAAGIPWTPDPPPPSDPRVRRWYESDPDATRLLKQMDRSCEHQDTRPAPQTESLATSNPPESA